MNKAILGEGGTVMQFVGDAVMAVFGAPFPQADHADRAVAAAAGMHALQAEINAAWLEAGLPEFGLGLGLSTGEAAAALLGSAERLEYTLVGDTVNMSQRLQQFAAAGETVISAATRKALTTPVALTALPAQLVKGRETPVVSFKIDPAGTAGLPAETPPAASTAAGTTEPRFAPAEASQKAEGNRKWKLWKSRNGTR
jgi:class 3 adenylate cyclase